MIKFWGQDAEARLAEAWETVLSHDPAGQAIIHVQAPMTVHPDWIDDFPPFQAWMRNNRTPDQQVWRSFTEIAGQWPYIANARRAAAAGIPNVRTLVLPSDQYPAWLQYLAEVHMPALCAMSGEKFYRIPAHDCLSAGIPVRDHDVNLWGAAGVMFAGGDNGDVEWRSFVEEADDPELYRKELGFLMSMRDFALGQREAADLPDLRLDQSHSPTPPTGIPVPNMSDQWAAVEG